VFKVFITPKVIRIKVNGMIYVRYVNCDVIYPFEEHKTPFISAITLVFKLKRSFAESKIPNSYSANTIGKFINPGSAIRLTNLNFNRVCRTRTKDKHPSLKVICCQLSRVPPPLI